MKDAIYFGDSETEFATCAGSLNSVIGNNIEYYAHHPDLINKTWKKLSDASSFDLNKWYHREFNVLCEVLEYLNLVEK